MGWKRASILVWIIGWWSLTSLGAVPELSRPVTGGRLVPGAARQAQGAKSLPADSIRSVEPQVVADSVSVASGDSVGALLQDSVPLMITDSLGQIALADTAQLKSTRRKSWRPASFNPDPMRAVWLSALFPGLGQIYNRRYWKLPIVVGGYVGLFYATTWNSNMLADYQRAYLDIMDSDPTTNSYMDFFSSAYKEEDIDKEWLTSVLKQRKDYYRQYRDLCIICMIGLYAVCMIDAYVDAQLYHFDVSPDISMQWQPAVIPTGRSALPAVGVQCAITF
ncbi:DUF5683 domain-containing protein [Barnesiella viscericola]|uniref:DUF5683 domain-containing protein n=1 Tax=Barnesiella viscericola TaxID=397865 RepID=UPI0025A4AEC9|nr:DUF5683 domain-containing protein [Barnesiella viscericola]MDM8267578.1 DUF5683 domain-containing protein [Barnesiella viscericola]